MSAPVIDQLRQSYGGIPAKAEPHDAGWLDDMRRIWAAERKGERECQEREARQALEAAQREVTA